MTLVVKSHNEHPSAVGSASNLPSEPVSEGSVPASTRVADKPRRIHRKRPAAEKVRIVLAFKACQTPAERGALLRKEGIYYDQAVDWLNAYEKDGPAAFESKASKACASSTQRAMSSDEADKHEILRLRRELEKQKKRAEQAEAIVGIQKKVLLLWESVENPNGTKS